VPALPSSTFKLPVKLSVVVAVGLVGILAVAAAYSLTRSSNPPVPSHFTMHGKTFPITFLATTQAEREAGLMNKTITDATTMLFVFPVPGYYPFWMYHTDSSLDIMWLSVNGSAGLVVYLVQAAPTCFIASQCVNYIPSAEANYVLEAKAGFAEANNITVGTSVAFG
jgi:uncharacterized membrane protein (UPF0127 family)